MKKILSLLGFCVLAFHGFGQVKKIEKRSYGLLDSVYYVNGGDTVCVETYYGNGLVEGRVWKNDSTEQFDRNGRLMSRTQNHIKHEKLPSFWGIDLLHKNTKFYPNGLIMYESKWQGDTMWTEQTLEPNGKVISQNTRGETRSSDGQSVNFYSNTFDEENLVETEITDTLHKLNIEKYYNKNGKIIKIKTRNINDFQISSYLSYVFYDDNEKIEYKWSLDSNRLNADKDNGDCMYGFRDLRGNWVIPPQYDNVKRFNMSYYIVNKNEKYGVIDDFGKTILPLDFDFLGILGVGMSEEISLGQVYNNVYKPRSSVALRCRMGNKYGVVDFMGKVLLPPQYDDVRKMQNDTFEVQIGKKWGLVDSKGRIIVQPIYDKVNFTKLSTFFEVIDTLERQGTNYKIVHEIKGLINDKGKVFLDRKFEELNQELDDPNIFSVKSYNKNVEFVNDLREGIFNINKGWLFDTAYHFQNDDICQFYKRHPLYKDSIEATLYGCVNEKYEIILPFEYDFIESFTKTQYNPDSCTGGHTGSCSTNNTFFICKKDGKFGVFDKQKALWQIPLIYDYIHCFKIDYTRIEEYKPYENIVRLLVLKDGNWQWIDERGTPLSDDLIDYAGIYENGCFTVKNNIITNHNGDFYPNNEPLERIKNDKSETQSEFIYFKDFKDRELLVNSNGKMAVPPQYFIISSFGKYTIAKDSAKKQWLFDIEGNKRPFLQQYKII
jgi:WG containing repeat